jgi:hypothetical protein
MKFIREKDVITILVGHGEKKSHSFSLPMYLYSFLYKDRPCLDVVYIFNPSVF